MIEPGKKIEWCRGEQPREVRSNSGVLAATDAALFKGDRDIETLLAFSGGTIWQTEPRALAADHTQTLRRIEWARPSAPAKVFGVTFDVPPRVHDAIAAKQRALGGPELTIDPLDRLRILATEKGLVFWDFHSPCLWLLPTEAIDARP